MPTLSISDMDVKLRHEKNRFERPAPLGATGEPTRWALRCMHVDCMWAIEGLQSELAARTGAELHNDGTGHPVKLLAVVEFHCDVIRTEAR